MLKSIMTAGEIKAMYNGKLPQESPMFTIAADLLEMSDIVGSTKNRIVSGMAITVCVLQQTKTKQTWYPDLLSEMMCHGYAEMALRDVDKTYRNDNDVHEMLAQSVEIARALGVSCDPFPKPILVDGVWREVIHDASKNPPDRPANVKALIRDDVVDPRGWYEEHIGAEYNVAAYGKLSDFGRRIVGANGMALVQAGRWIQTENGYEYVPAGARHHVNHVLKIDRDAEERAIWTYHNATEDFFEFSKEDVAADWKSLDSAFQTLANTAKALKAFGVTSISFEDLNGIDEPMIRYTAQVMRNTGKALFNVISRYAGLERPVRFGGKQATAVLEAVTVSNETVAAKIRKQLDEDLRTATSETMNRRYAEVLATLGNVWRCRKADMRKTVYRLIASLLTGKAAVKTIGCRGYDSEQAAEPANVRAKHLDENNGASPQERKDYREKRQKRAKTPPAPSQESEETSEAEETTETN